MQRLIASIRFWAIRPFAVAAFKWREWRRWRHITPRLWLSPGEILHRDLEHYLDEGRNNFDLKFIEDFAKARDDLHTTIKKQILFSATIFLFILSNYLSLRIDVNIFGFSLKNSPGIVEALLLISNLLSAYTLILQGNAYALDATVKFAISAGLPEELRNIYLIRYFPHEYFGRYQPFNLPYIIPNKLHRGIAKMTSLLFLIILIATALAYSLFNIFLLFHYLLIAPNFGIWSNLLLIYILSCGAIAVLYIFVSRFRLPYVDFTVNSELELLQQVNPKRHRLRLEEIYGELNADRQRMEELGYLRKRR